MEQVLVSSWILKSINQTPSSARIVAEQAECDSANPDPVSAWGMSTELSGVEAAVEMDSSTIFPA